MMKICVYLLVLEIISVNYAQRVAPGVPPQHYQQQQHPHMQQQQHINQMPIQQQPMHQVPIQQQQQQQKMHHVPVQQQTAPQQMHPPVQQVPIQQQQVPIQQQQVPVQAHHGHHGQHNGQILNAANIAHEKEHIAEHMDIPMDTSKMSEQELQFHYFKMHDADNNNKLDGCELIKSLIHWHEQGGKEKQHQHGQGQVDEKIFKDDELVALIDPILGMDDGNFDGYIDYPEFVRAQQKAAAAAAAPKTT